MLIPLSLSSYATKTGICTVGVSAFSLMNLSTILGCETDNLVAEQALKIDFGDYTETEKERMNTIIDGIHSGDVGQVEVLGFPGFFTSKSERYFLSCAKNWEVE